MFCLVTLTLCVFATALNVFAADVAVSDFGAKGDGVTDATAAFQKALDAAAQGGNGIVSVPGGNYFFTGHLSVPDGVTLAGTWQSVPAHDGIRDRGMPKPTDGGTTFLVTEGEGNEEGHLLSPCMTTAH